MNLHYILPLMNIHRCILHNNEYSPLNSTPDHVKIIHSTPSEHTLLNSTPDENESLHTPWTFMSILFTQEHSSTFYCNTPWTVILIIYSTTNEDSSLQSHIYIMLIVLFQSEAGKFLFAMKSLALLFKPTNHTPGSKTQSSSTYKALREKFSRFLCLQIFVSYYWRNLETVHRVPLIWYLFTVFDLILRDGAKSTEWLKMSAIIPKQCSST